jgi:hypothetical protein
MKRKQFGHIICSRRTELKYLLLYRATNEYLSARRVQPVSKTHFSEMLIDSISVEHLAGKVIKPLYRRVKHLPDKLKSFASKYKLVPHEDGERYFERVPAKRRK